MRSSKVVSSVLFLVALASPGLALADVITGEPARPMDCPLGATPARPMRGHGFYCAVAPACTTDADCAAGGSCQDTAVCVLPGSDTAPYVCGADGSCFSGECSRARRCVPPPIGTIPAPSPPSPPAPSPSPAPSSPAEDAGGLCAVSHVAASARSPGARSSLSLGFLGLVVVLRRARRRGSAQSTATPPTR